MNKKSVIATIISSALIIFGVIILLIKAGVWSTLAGFALPAILSFIIYFFAKLKNLKKLFYLVIIVCLVYFGIGAVIEVVLFFSGPRYIIWSSYLVVLNRILHNIPRVYIFLGVFITFFVFRKRYKIR